MLGGFFNKLAGKSSLYNMKCDLDGIHGSLPRSAGSASKHLLSLMVNIMYARDNGVSDAQIARVISDSCASRQPELQSLAKAAHETVVAALEQRPDSVLSEQQLAKVFRDVTGSEFRPESLPFPLSFVDWLASMREGKPR